MSNDYREWYLRNRKALSVRRKRRYATDTKFRDKQLKRSRQSWEEGEPERVVRRQKEIDRRLKVGEKSFYSTGGSRNHPRIVRVKGKLRKVYGITVLARLLGVSVKTLRTRWAKFGALPPPTLVDEKDRPWFDHAYLEFMVSVVRDYRAKYWSLDDFSVAVSREWEKRHGRKMKNVFPGC